jgi:hypothetical protein
MQGLLYGRPHLWLVVERMKKCPLFGRNRKARVLEFHGTGCGCEPILPQIPGKRLEKSVQQLFKIGLIVCILLERRFMAEALRSTVGNDRFVVNTTGQFLNPMETCAEQMVQSRLPSPLQ